MKSQGLREAAWLLAAGVLVAVGVVLVASVSTPEPPRRMALPTAGELVELEQYLDPADTELAAEAGVSPPVFIDGDPFGIEPVYYDWGGPVEAGGEAGGGGEGGPAPAAPRWTLSAVLVAGDRRSAIVNDQVVREGDRLEDGTRVEAVGDDHVVIVTPDGVRRRLGLERQGS